MSFHMMYSRIASNPRQRLVQVSDGPAFAQQIDENAYLVSTGARLVLPIWRQRILLSAGGGWAGLFIEETIDSGSNGSYYGANPLDECRSCESRHWWGPTTVAEVMVFPRRDSPVGFGFHVRTIQIYSDGVSLRTPGTAGRNDRFTDDRRNRGVSFRRVK